jgi:hypothetical protein
MGNPTNKNNRQHHPRNAHFIDEPVASIEIPFIGDAKGVFFSGILISKEWMGRTLKT